MTRRKSPLVAHVVLMSFVLDPALAARVAPTPVKAAATVPQVSAATAPASGARGARPAKVPQAVSKFAPLLASLPLPVAMLASVPAAQIEGCEDALTGGSAPVTTLSRTHLWPPNHALIDIALAVDPTPECAGLVGLEVAVWGDEADDAPTGDGTTIGDAQFDVPDLYLRAERVAGSDGRVYLVITRASTSGAEGVNCRTVSVPHSGSTSSLTAVDQQAAAARAACEATGTAPPSFFLLAEAEFTQANQAPMVAAGPDQGVPFPGSATLDGTTSDDGLPDGTLELEWTQASGPGQATFSDAHIEDPVVTFSVAGSYTLRLTARDGELESHDDVVIVLGNANEAPQVDAGDDRSLVLPVNVAALQGTATDDGHPNPALTVSWSVVTVPAGGSVVFSAPTALATTATLSMAGDYVLRLTAHDGQLSSADDLTVALHPEAPPILSVSDRSVPEGNDGRGGGELHATLSKSWPRAVTVDFMTSDGSANAHCDYSFRYGTLTFNPGQTEASLLVPVMGELAPEAAETVLVHLGNVTEAILAGDQAVLTIVDDDAANQPPAAHASRSPADLATGVALPPTLSWLTSDPDPGDTVVHDIYLGTAPSLDGQSWAKVCPATPGPGPSSVFGFADAADRVVVLEQESDGSTGSRVWIQEDASGAGGPPRWTSFDTQDHPVLGSSRAAYDVGTDALIVVGRCESCGGAIQAWILHDASGNGTPAWQQISASGAPVDVARFAMAHSEATNRLFLFGGVGGGGTRLADLWVLDGVNGTGNSTWTHLEPQGDWPSGRDAASLVVDTRGSRLILFGGSVSDVAATNEVWALSGLGTPSPGWQLLPTTPGPAPTPRFGHAAAFDAGSGRMLVFGGSTPGIADHVNFVFGDAWLLDGLTWTRISVPAAAPAGRFDGIVAFSPSANRLIVGAGENNKIASSPADLWVLSDAMGRLPAVALGQVAASSVQEGLDPSATYLWRVVSRDTRGARRGSATWNFTANGRPLVDAGADVSITLPATAPLSASASDDGHPAGGTLAFAWERVHGSAGVAFQDATAPATAASFTAAGTYVLTVTVSDGALTASDSLTVIVAAANLPPEVAAGPDQQIVLPTATASLAGTATDDGRPVEGRLVTTWSRVSGPGGVTFQDPSAVATTVAFGAAGEHVLELAATDSTLTASDRITVEVFPPHDLAIRSLDARAMVTNPDDLSVSGTLSAEIENASGGPIAQPFDVVFFEDRNGNATYEATADNTFGSVRVPGLAARTISTVTATVSGTVLFYGNTMHALVDAASEVPESDEANNYRDTVPPCMPFPPAPFAPRLKWAWHPPHDETLGSNVMMTPAVADLDGDGTPEVIFTAHWPNNWAGSGKLWALSGADGHPVFSTTVFVTAIGQIAIGDIDRDGRPEIVATQGARVIAFEHTGAMKWASALFRESTGWGGPALADLDGDGSPEIVVGRRVLNADGSLRWTGEAVATAPNGPLSIVADLDLDGSPEIIVGSIAYRADGTTYWRAPGISGGLNAVGDFDADPFPEIVTVANGSVWLLEHDGVAKWGPIPLPGGGHGGPPTIGDVDGDGEPEIGVAGLFRYVVFETDGSVKWAAPIVDGNSHVTAASVFDFEGDGSAEIVHRDQARLRVFRGATGQVLFETLMPSATAYENPVIADVNGDGSAEIVAVADGGPYGVFVYESANDGWVATRKIWNQHTYHITNVNEDLTIPALETNSWQTYNSYRQNRLTTGCAFARPDLTASYLRRDGGGPEIVLTVRIGNSGGAGAPPLPVSFYDGNPATGGVLLGTVQTAGVIPSGGFQEVLITLPQGTLGLPVWAVADDAGGLVSTVLESDEANNAYASRVYLTATPNEPPVVNAGPDQVITLPQLTTTLPGMVTDDGLPIGQVTVAWGLVAGPGPVAFGNSDSPVTTATFEVEGEYVLRLRGSDADKDAADDLIVRVRPRRPDLTVASVDTAAVVVNGQTLTISGQARAEVSNVGVEDAGPFDVVVYEERDGQPGFDPRDNALGSVTVSPLAAGASTPVVVAVPGTVLFRGSALHAFADAARAVQELDEDNNDRAAPRACELPGGCTGAEPDLIPSFVRKTTADPDIVVTVRIGNAGGGAAPPDVIVALYDGPPSPGRRLGIRTTSAGLAPGASEDVAVTLPASITAAPIFVVVDDPASGGVVVESIETNNVYDSRVYHPDRPNDAPLVRAGPDQILDHPLRETMLAGSATDDGIPGGPPSLQWRQVTGAGTTTFSNAAAATTGAAFSAPGTYLLRLEADDGELIGSDDVVVAVDGPNTAPLVSAGSDRSVTSPSFDLAGVVSDDGLPRSAAFVIQWQQVSGPGPALLATPGAAATRVLVPEPGTYVFSLQASDSQLSAADEVAIQVTFVNQPPAVNAGADQSITLPLNTVILTGNAADDGVPVGAVLAYSWSQVAGPSAAVFDAPSSPSATATFGGPGAYVLRLTVSDGVLAGNDEVAVQVGGTDPTGPPPTASVTSPAPGLSLGQPTMVRGSVASDTLAGWRLEHRLAGEGPWTRFGFGTTDVTDADLAAFDPTLLLNGLYHIRLVATDTAGRSGQATTQVVVKDNFKVGHFTVSFVDLEVPVAGIPIQVGRTYDSRDKRAGDFGPGWRLDVSNVRVEETGTAGLGWVGTRTFGQFPTYCLQTQSPKVVAVTLPNGLVFEFDALITPSCRTFVPPEEVTVSYRPRAGTQGTLVPINGNVAAVIGGWPEAGGSAQMQLFRVTDYSLFDPEAYALTLPDGRAFVVSQLEGLQRITDLSGNVLSVNRSGITHSSGRGVVFVRNTAGAIMSVVDPDGRPTVYAYLPSGDLDAVTDREGHATRFRYHPVIAHHLESIQDPLGRTPLRNEYDEDGRLERHIDAFGKVIEYTHSIGVRQEIVKDRNDKQRVLEYDERGNVAREIDPTGKVVVRTFDLRNNRLSETAPHVPGTPTPPATVYVYDAHDNVTKVTDPEGNRTEYTYNARKQVRTTKDALDRVTENTYDPVTGNPLTTRDALNQVTTYTYDGQGNVKTQTVTVDGVPHVTLYDYDAHGNLTRETDALGHETNFTHDANGNRLTQTTSRGIYTCTAVGCTQTSAQTLTTTYVYDLAGRLLETQNPDGTATRTVYDEMGRQKETYGALGHRTAYTYDDMGRLTRTSFVDGTFEESTYDNEGQRLTSKDREGRITSYVYDDVGRLTRTTYPDLTFVESTYDDAGRLVASRDARGKTTTYGYDRAGRRTSVKDPLPNETIFGYDANGNQTTVRDALLRTKTYEYDLLNRRTKAIFPDLSFTTTTYDALGCRRSETDQAGKTTAFEYDRVGRLTQVTDAAGKHTNYTYDELGNRIAQRDANGRVTAFEYDKMGRETARILPDGAREAREYDAAGNVRQRTDFMGRTATYSYDAMNRLTSRTYPDAVQNVSFTYTPAGRRLTATDARGTTTYGYDVRQRLETLTYPDGRKLEYGYDANGNRASLMARIDALAISTAFTYDDAGRLDVVTDPAGRTYDHAYDANGNRDSLAYPNGTVTDYTYNTLNRLTLLSTTHPASGRTIQSYAFTLGPAGNRTAITESDGTVRAYTYDNLYRLTGERVTIGVPLEYEKVFTYDDVGNRHTQLTTGSGAPGTPLAPGSLAYAYDTRDRLLTETLGVNPPTPFDYDANGNLISKSSEATYTWDFENRLTRVAKTDGTLVEHAYDADGNRVQTRVTPATGPPVVTDFLVDASGSLSHAVAETDDAGALKVYYVRADDLLGVMRPLVPGPAVPEDWQTRFLHADGIGSIRRLTDEAGLITDGYTYTAFGEVLAHTGTDPQPYAFAGEPYDPNSGLQYHRARWMDAGAGRFLGMDSFDGRDGDPRTLHKYVYGACDPANERDPTGYMFTAADVGNAMVAISVLFSMAVPRMGAFLQATAPFADLALKTIFWADAALTTAGAAGVVAGGVLDSMSASLESADAAGHIYPAGNKPRGYEIGDIAGQNLSDTFPVIDSFDFDNGVATSIKSTTQVQSRTQLVNLIGGYAGEFDLIDDDLIGYNRQGVRVVVPWRGIHVRNVLVVVPPLTPDVSNGLAAELSRVARVMGANIRVVQVRGLRRP